MDSPSVSVSKEYYLKGNWRHWFWAIIAILAVSIVPNFINRIDWNETAAFLFAGFKSFLVSAGYAALYLIYGIKNRIKVFTVLFIILAVIQLPWMVYRFFDDYAVINTLLSNNNKDLFDIVVNSASYFNNAFVIIFITSYIIISCTKKANTLLRISSIVAAVVVLLEVLAPRIVISSGYLHEYGPDAFSSLLSLISSILN